jgi:hypothetical protein
MIVVTAVMAAGTIVTGLLLRHHGPGSDLSAPLTTEALTESADANQ